MHVVDWLRVRNGGLGSIDTRATIAHQDWLAKAHSRMSPKRAVAIVTK